MYGLHSHKEAIKKPFSSSFRIFFPIRKSRKAVPNSLSKLGSFKRNIVAKEKLGFDGKIIFPEHHQSHAGSAFFPSPFKEAAFITIDGVGEWATASYGIGKGNKIQMLAAKVLVYLVWKISFSVKAYFLLTKINL